MGNDGSKFNVCVSAGPDSPDMVFRFDISDEMVTVGEVLDKVQIEIERGLGDDDYDYDEDEWGFEDEENGEDDAEWLAHKFDDASLLEFREEEGITALTWRCVNSDGTAFRNSMRMKDLCESRKKTKGTEDVDAGEVITVEEARCGKDKNWLNVRLPEYGIKYLPITKNNHHHQRQ